MKQFLKKPMGLAVAATLAMGGMTAYTNAVAATNANATGDLAIVPYYTTKNNMITGVQIVNTSDSTQVVKFRLRRDTDSADVLDFNIIMSPKDHWSGYVTKVGDNLIVNTNDNTCTAPLPTNNQFVSPVASVSKDADEGYIEIIAMGQTTDEAQPVAVAAKHQANGSPLNCAAILPNFEAGAAAAPASPIGVQSNASTASAAAVSADGTKGPSTFVNPTDVLKVSFFIRDAASGMEMGDNATHISAFSGDPMMTNQQAGFGLANGGTAGFDFPDLDGAGSNGGARGLYNTVIRADLGATAVINNWSYNPANNVATDWVVTIPGQYLMKNPSSTTALPNTDLPLTASITIFDREEKGAAGGAIVVSPGIPGGKTTFPNEVNVVEWGGKSVFGSDNAVKVDPKSSGIDKPFGWASLTLTAADRSAQAGGSAPAGTINGQQVYNLTVNPATPTAATGRAPVIGFAGWLRKFDSADRNYGRMISHSRQ